MIHICCIAAQDTSGGAGVTHDCIVANDFGIMAHPVITAITAQSFSNVERIEPIPAELVKIQLESIFNNFPIAGIKIGMLYNPSIIKGVAEFLSQQTDVLTVIDPILKSSGGEQLITQSGYQVLKDRLLPRASIITPNRHELVMLSNLSSINSIEDAFNAAHHIANQYQCKVLIKGGHFDGTILNDYLIGKSLKVNVSHERRQYKYSHGSGCTLSTALTCSYALGYKDHEALKHAVEYTTKYFDSINISMFQD